MEQNYIYDIAIIGMGTAGLFASIKLMEGKKDIITFETGAGPSKRRHSIFGFLGSLPSGDGKIYLSDLNKVKSVAGATSTNAAKKLFDKYFKKVSDYRITRDSNVTSTLAKKIEKNGFQIEYNDYIQIIPKELHALSKIISKEMEDSEQFVSKYNLEIQDIKKNKDYFILIDEHGNEHMAKKVIMAPGRGGWRWAAEIFKKLGLDYKNDQGLFGIRVETTMANLKSFNESSCKLTKSGKLNYQVGPFNWGGTIIPEDQGSAAITAFRSNENRWKTDKVSFDVLLNKTYDNNAFEEIDRLTNLSFIITNERILKERVSYLLNEKSKLSILPDYKPLIPIIQDLSEIIQDINKCYFYAPTAITLAPKVNYSDKFETQLKGLYVVGETAGEQGILFSALSGICAAAAIMKDKK